MAKTIPWISLTCPLRLNCISTPCRSNLSSRVFQSWHPQTSVFKIWYSSYLVLSGSRSRSVFTCSLTLAKWSPYFLVSSLQIRSLRKRSFLSEIVLPLLSDKGLAVFRYYIPFPIKLGRNFLNPLFKDSKTPCNVYFDRRNGMYKMKDFGNDDYSEDCFALVGKQNGLNCKEPKGFVEILAIINRNMRLGLSNKPEMRISSTKPRW